MVDLETRPAAEGTAIPKYVYRAPTIVRFLAVGGVASLLQLLLLYLIQLSGIPKTLLAAAGQGERLDLYLIQLSGISKIVANFFAFEISTQVNFALSYLITWHERTPERPTVRYIRQRLFAFNGMAITTLIINLSVFALLLTYVHFLIAGAAGIIAATATNFILSSWLIFRRREGFSRGPIRTT